MKREEFIVLTDNEVNEKVFVRREDIVIIVPLTEDILHKGDYNYTDRYDKNTIFSGIQTKYGIIHVKEKPEEIFNKLFIR